MIYLGYAMTLGMAQCFNQLAMMLVQIVMNNSLRHYGALSVYGEAIPLACSGIINKVSFMFFAFCIGIAQGMQPIASFNYGAKNYDRVKKVIFLSLSAGQIICITAFCLFQISLTDHGSVRKWVRSVLLLCRAVFPDLSVLYLYQ